MALSFLGAMRRTRMPRETALLVASTGGSDGPTDAAGAFASREIGERARSMGLDPVAYLPVNDSHQFHDRVGSLLRTGQTYINVSDVALLLVR